MEVIWHLGAQPLLLAVDRGGKIVTAFAVAGIDIMISSVHRRTNYLRGGSALGRWTCDLQVAGSIPAGGFHVT